MIVLGLTRAAHDPSAALVKDGEVLAAAEEERFVRRKHATGRMPLEAARFCLKVAGVDPGEVDAVAYPWSLDTYRRNRWSYVRNHLSLPRSALRALLRTRPRWAREMARLTTTLAELGVSSARLVFVPHHVAHAASAFYPSGMAEAAILSVDATDEGAAEISVRSRGTPRIANRLLRRVRDFADVRADGVVDAATARDALLVFEVDERGLDRVDRAILEGDPHAVLEGMIIAAAAIGANQGYVYVRSEYPLAVSTITGAIRQAEEHGLLGDGVLGSEFNFKIKIKEGAGAFVCGEETALIASIEGERGMPRPRPPTA